MYKMKKYLREFTILPFLIPTLLVMAGITSDNLVISVWTFIFLVVTMGIYFNYMTYRTSKETAKRREQYMKQHLSIRATMDALHCKKCGKGIKVIRNGVTYSKICSYCKEEYPNE